MSDALRIEQLTVNYEHQPVLWDINCTIPSGQLVGIIGPNGAGKSTLIKAALGLIPTVTGCVTFFDSPLNTVRQRVAYVPQRETVDWDFPVTSQDLVLMGCYGRLGLLRRPSRSDVEAARHYLDKVGMLEFADRQISQLSGGQQQRVFLARALMQEADFYLMDEPFAGVDMTTEKVLVQLLRDLRDEGRTVCIVHHDLNTVEAYFDWVIMLNLRLVASGPTADVFNDNTLNLAYGKSHVFLDEAVKLSQDRNRGMSN